MKRKFHLLIFDFKAQKSKTSFHTFRFVFSFAQRIVENNDSMNFSFNI